MGINLTELYGIKKQINEETIRLSEDSVDSQIDSVLLRYQDESSLEDEELNEGYKMPDNWNLLLEAEGDEEQMNPQDVMTVGDDLPRSKEPKDPVDQKINIDDFAQKVANLYEHYDNLLNVKPVIVHRAMHTLERGYSPEVVNEFLETLEREFGITPEGDAEEEVPMAPPGGSAGPIGA